MLGPRRARCPRLAVEDDGGKRGAEIAVTAREGEAAVGAGAEGVRDGLHVAWRGVGRGEALDELCGHEGRDVLVPEEVLDQRVGLVLGVTDRRAGE